MKLTLERSDALAALTRVTGVVTARSSVDILRNVLIVASDNCVTFRATDLDMEATSQCAAEISEAGSLTVDAQKLREVVAASAQGSQIGVELKDDGRLHVSSGRSRFKLPVMAADSFPTIPADTGAAEIQIDAPTFTDMLERALMSASSEVVRYYLCGVYLHVEGGRLRTAATNGHHLTYRDGPKCKAKFDGVIIPTKAATEMIKAMKDRTGDVALSVSSALVGLTVGDSVIRAKTVDGNFPDYKRVIPSPPENLALIDSDSLSIALRRAQIASEDKIRSVLMDFAPGVLTVRGRGQSEAMDEVEIEYDGPERTLSFNSGYIAGILDHTDGAVEVRFGGEVDHTTWRGASDDDGLTVMLPIRQGGNG